MSTSAAAPVDAFSLIGIKREPKNQTANGSLVEMQISSCMATLELQEEAITTLKNRVAMAKEALLAAEAELASESSLVNLTREYMQKLEALRRGDYLAVVSSPIPAAESPKKSDRLIKALLKGPRTVKEISQETQLKVKSIYNCLHGHRKKGWVIGSGRLWKGKRWGEGVAEYSLTPLGMEAAKSAGLID